MGSSSIFTKHPHRRDMARAYVRYFMQRLDCPASAILETYGASPRPGWSDSEWKRFLDWLRGSIALVESGRALVAPGKVVDELEELMEGEERAA